MNQTAVEVDDELATFAKRFLTGRVNWRAVPRLNNVTNFGNVISFVLYREGQYQVELFIIPNDISTFTEHRHPDVDVVEFGLCGEGMLLVNGKLSHTEDELKAWLDGHIPTYPVRVRPTDMHSGYGMSPYAFLSIQHWLHGVVPSSVGLNWIGEPASVEQAQMLAVEVQ